MKTLFKVDISNFTTIKELPNAWSNEDYVKLLEVMEFPDASEIAASELKEMCLMAITDNEPNEAAKIVLDYLFEDRLNEGQKDNISHEMIDEKIWEEYADLSMHEEFFNAGQLLHQAYNGKFPLPDAVKFQMTVTGKNTHELTVLEGENEAPILRLLASGMPENTLINRLFSDQLEGESFLEAENIIWQIKKIKEENASVTYEVISSAYWFHDLKFVNSFEAATHKDEEVEEEED